MKKTLLHITLCVVILLCLCNASLGQATITKTVDNLQEISADLGDKLRVTLAANNSYNEPVLVVDNLGYALKYVGGTCILDGISLTPTLGDNKISVSVGPGHHVITYEFQVVLVEASNTYISNVAQIYGCDSSIDDEASVYITLGPYDGFFKWLSSNTHDLAQPLPLGEDIEFLLEVNVRNYFDFIMEDVEIRDDLPAEFEVDSCWCETGALTVTTQKGKGKKFRWTWIVGDLAGDGEGVSCKIWLSTALNPAGKQHFISPGWYDVAKEVVLKFNDPSTGNELRAYTGSFSVYAGTP